MSLEVGFASAKFAAVIITGIWAVIGLQVNFRDSEGRITKWGRRALFWSVISASVAIGTQALETVIKRREDEASAEKTRSILREIRRAVYPIQNVYITSNVIVPRAGLPTYAAKLERASGAIAKRQPPYRDDDADAETDDSGNPVKVSLGKASTLYPATRSSERALLVDVGLEFHFYKNPVDLDSIQSIYSLPQADLEFLVRPTEAQIEYSLRNKKFFSLAMNMEANARDIHWRSNGKIASLADLDGVQLIVAVEDAFGEDRSSVQLLLISIDLGGRRLFIGAGLVRLPKADPKSPMYTFSFPQHVLEADEYLGQNKSAQDKVDRQAIAWKERRQE
jgi:hypothetical protein